MTDAIGFATAALLVEVWNDQDVDALWEGETHCIEATKIGLAILRELDVKAQQLPCGILIANEAGGDFLARRVPIEEWPAHAWSVGVDPDQRMPGRGWDGHLVIRGDGWVADLAAGQFARPGLIDVDAFVAPLPPSANEMPRWTFANDGKGTTVTIAPRPELRRYKSSSAWRQPSPPKVVAAVVDAVRDRLGVLA